MNSDRWENDGVNYTMDVYTIDDVSSRPRATITAQRSSERMIYTRIVPKLLDRREVEKLFAVHLARPF